MLALTFDLEHYDEKIGDVNRILDALAKYHMVSCFFVTGKVAIQESALLKKIINSGHMIASHGFSHTILSTLPDKDVEQEIIATEKAIEKATGARPIGFRAPKLCMGKYARSILKSRGYAFTSNRDTHNIRGGSRFKSICCRILWATASWYDPIDIPLTATMDWYFSDLRDALPIWKKESRSYRPVFTFHPWLVAEHDAFYEFLEFLNKEDIKTVLPPELAS